MSSGNGDIWILETTRPGSTRFTLDEANESLPIWTPGDDRLIYMINPERAGANVVMKSLKAGSALETILGDPALAEYPSDVSRDGRFLLVDVDSAGASASSGGDIHVYSMEEKTSTPFLASAAAEGSGVFSPDGKWVAYLSDESGRNEVYVQSFPTPGAQWQISTSGGSWRNGLPTGGSSSISRPTGI